jgi:DNA-binding winged helix-turn-helix (wHTH) protein
MLLQRPGEVVTREELQKHLWPADTFVDFEHSVNAAIKRLRAALGDSADSPRFIETLARRGYRFIAPISQLPVKSETSVSEPEASQPAAAVRRVPKLAAAATAAAVLVAAAALFVSGVLQHRTVTSSIRSLAVLPLANLSADKDQDFFVDGMTDALRENLEGIFAPCA